MDNGRQRLAWSVLLIGFFFCLLATVSVPLIANAAVQNAMRPLTVVLQSYQGTVVVDDAEGNRTPLLPGEPAVPVAANREILTSATDAALMLAYTPDGARLLTRLQLYGNSDLTIERAAWPRFGWSNEDAVLRLRVEGGRLRLKLLPDEERQRPLRVELQTPQARIEIRQPGQYSIEVDNADTQVAVQEGQAAVIGLNQQLNVDSGERAVVANDSAPEGPLATERDLIANGTFSQGISNWALLPWDVERSGQPAGSARVSEASGEPVFYVRRDGEGHADISLRQSVDYDVTDFGSLNLQLAFRINVQSLGVCGVQGSECPLTVRVEYDDGNGVTHTWQQGFYSVGVVTPEETPDICITCATAQREHQFVAPGQLFFYETDLLDELAQQGAPPPSRIKSVSLVVAGHTFEVEVADVSLIGDEAFPEQ